MDANAPEDPASSPVIILTASRSGSTLLRFILDSHPDLACPPETSVATTCGQLASTLTTLEGVGHSVDEPIVPSPGTAAIIRATIDLGFDGYLRRRGKPRWCDKSLDNVQHADLIAQIYPNAKFLCLFRHCMDVIASGVEACPWGLHRFGYDPFVARHPGNSVAAIGDYWLMCAHLIMAFEQRHPERCHRVRYEDLVAEPERTAAQIFSFLEVEQVPGITRACFEREHEADGPSDEKIWFTRTITAGSVGRGTTVPVGAIPPAMLTAMNEALAGLGYKPVDENWNFASGPIDPRLDTEPAPAATGQRAADHAELAVVVQAIDARIASRLDSQRSAITGYWPRLAGATIGIVVQGVDGAQREMRVRLPGEGADGAGPPPMVIADPATWTSLLDGKANLITEISAGRIRCVNTEDRYRIRTDELHAVAWLLGLTQVPLARTPNGAPPVQPVPA